MEVHAHTHTPRKKWTHYFWEFLMLFLAVFCGFLAEYQLEHKIERDRGKQFMESLSNDLKADILHLKTIIDNKTKRQVLLDSLMLLLNTPEYINMRNSIYYQAIQVSRRNPTQFTPNNGTMQQLKNSGGLRLIKKRNIADSIARYDVSTRNMEKFDEIETTIFIDYRSSASKFFNSLVFEKMLDEDNNVTRTTNNPELLTYSKNDLDEINYKIHRLKFTNRGSKRDAQRLLKQAENFLSVLKKEYHLK